MAPGIDGALDMMLTANVFATLLPQLLLAFTEIVPPVLPVVVIIELVVEVPVQPDGKVQV